MAFIANTKAQTSTGSPTTLTLNVPAGVVDGDILVACIMQSSVTAPGTPTGWTRLTGAKMTYDYRVASGEPASYTWTWAGAETWVMGIMAAYTTDGVLGTVHTDQTSGTTVGVTHADVDIVSHAGAIVDTTVPYFTWIGFGGSPFQFGSTVTWANDAGNTTTTYRDKIETPAGASFDNSLALFDEDIGASQDPEPARAFDADWGPNTGSNSWKVNRIVVFKTKAVGGDHWAWAEGADTSDSWQIV